MYTYADESIDATNITMWASASSTYTSTMKIVGKFSNSATTQSRISECVRSYIENHIQRRVDDSEGPGEIDWDYYFCADTDPIERRRIPINIGATMSCWLRTGVRPDGSCAYDFLRQPCAGKCIPTPGVVSHDPQTGPCPLVEGYIVPWFQVGGGATICSPGGFHTDVNACICGDVSNLP